MKKILRILYLFIILLFSTGCKNMSLYILGIKQGLNIKSLEEKLNNKNIDYLLVTNFPVQYFIFIYNDQSCVIEVLNSSISKFECFEFKIGTDDDFYKLEKGMSIFDVVEYVGIPLDSVGVNFIDLIYLSSSNIKYLLLFNYNHVENINTYSHLKVID